MNTRLSGSGDDAARVRHWSSAVLWFCGDGGRAGSVGGGAGLSSAECGLGPFWARLGAIWGPKWDSLGPSWGPLGAPWGIPGASWKPTAQKGVFPILALPLGSASWRHLGAILASSWAILGPPWRHLGPMLGPSGPNMSNMGAILRPPEPIGREK